MIHIAGQANSKLEPLSEKQIQPNAVDLKVLKISKILDTVFEISEEEKIHRKTDEVPLTEGKWHLKPGSYEILFQGTITIGLGEAGFVITRSTLNRNGLFLTSGLYDSGYKGVMAGALHVTSGDAIITPGTRLGQFILFKSETLSMYAGDYGIGKLHDEEKYSKQLEGVH